MSTDVRGTGMSTDQARDTDMTATDMDISDHRGILITSLDAQYVARVISPARTCAATTHSQVIIWGWI